jgi:hypothetical protein
VNKYNHHYYIFIDNHLIFDDEVTFSKIQELLLIFTEDDVIDNLEFYYNDINLKKSKLILNEKNENICINILKNNYSHNFISNFFIDYGIPIESSNDILNNLGKIEESLKTNDKYIKFINIIKVMKEINDSDDNSDNNSYNNSDNNSDKDFDKESDKESDKDFDKESDDDLNIKTRVLLENEDFVRFVRIYINDYATINKFISRVHNPIVYEEDNDNLKFLFNIYESNHDIFNNFYSFICKPSIIPPDRKSNMKNNYQLLLSKKLIDDNKKVLLSLTRTNNNLNMALRYIVNY